MLSLSFFGALVLKALLPFLLLVAILDVLTQTSPQRIRRLYRSGRYSERTLSARLGLTRYRVRQALA